MRQSIRQKQLFMEANAKRGLILLQAIAIEWEKKLKSRSFHSLKIVAVKSRQDHPGQAD
jgi:hypothetical protein